MKTKEIISVNKVRESAENYFLNGFFCCEAVAASILDNFELDLPKEVISMTSGMAVGVGHSGCMCGALNGGIMILGMFFGRNKPMGPFDPQAVKCMELTHELHDWFKKATKKNAVCCRVLTREFDTAKAEHKDQCMYFTGICAAKTADIIIRELGLEREDTELDPVFM